ncbi:MAG TPA: hypothetical protein PLL78_02915 [Fimbriimonadaceae bacterium]|nr:hypothetical protein [Fimbriimonadaceae bacterium]HRJ95612.1 hypothetical protein [Fimbriimonadaceae bacterium]
MHSTEYNFSQAYGTRGYTTVGLAILTATGKRHAVLWDRSVVNTTWEGLHDIHPNTYDESWASGCDSYWLGGLTPTICGTVETSANRRMGIVWSGTTWAPSLLPMLNINDHSECSAIDTRFIVGWERPTAAGLRQAVAWLRPAWNVENWHPAGFSESWLTDTYYSFACGSVAINGASRAGLWYRRDGAGIAEFTDLQGANVFQVGPFKFTSSIAEGVCGSAVVGTGQTGPQTKALYWSLNPLTQTPAPGTTFAQVLPAPSNTAGTPYTNYAAYDISAGGTIIVGSAWMSSQSDEVPVYWELKKF